MPAGLQADTRAKSSDKRRFPAAIPCLINRRLRTLADEFLAGGRLKAIIDDNYAKVAALADADDVAWPGKGVTSGGTLTNVHRGYEQLTTEWIPTRTEQLLGKVYGPQGKTPLLPEKQAGKLSVVVEKVRLCTAQ